MSIAFERLMHQPSEPATATAAEKLAGRVPLRVCYVIDRLAFGGTETHLVRLINSLDRTRVVPHLCLLDGTDPQSQSLEPQTCETLRLGVKSLCSLKAMRQAVTLAMALRRWRIDLLQLHFPDSNYFGALVGRLAGVRRIVTTRRDLFYWVTPLHKKVGRRLDSVYHRWFVDALLANCRACVTAVESAGVSMPPRTAVVSNGIDLDAFASLPLAGMCQTDVRPTRIGAVTMLRPEKRLDLLVEAAATVCAQESAVFCVAGEGPMRPSLERKIQSLDLNDQFELPGLCNDVKAFLAELDIAILCSDSEGLSNALVEYMAAGRAIVATDVGGTKEVLEHGVTGLLVPPGDAQALAAAIRRLVNNETLRRSLGTAAREVALREFSIASMAQSHEAFYTDLCTLAR